MIENEKQVLDKLISCKEEIQEMQNFYRTKDYFDSKKFEVLKSNIGEVIQKVRKDE